MEKEIKHPLQQHPEEIRTSYLTLLASMASADGRIEPSELEKLKEFCRIAGLSDESLQKVVDAATGKAADTTMAKLEMLRTSTLRFSIMTDCIFMACADGCVACEEEKEILRIAKALDVKGDQIHAIRFYVDKANSVIKNKGMHDPKAVAKEIGDKLKAVDIPIESVLFAFESLPYYQNNEMKEMLKVLGFGLGMLTGVGPLIMLGLFGWKGVKWLGKSVHIN
ncbi:MAG TPA: hypothetical protein DCZ94_05025 [Lentisphaeria bacterium]|nr:MAG: hypothetical protein A2X48_07785 [Lentisphaerae bacterium GWF2_49_21]HBC86300.1 hypothetical protein [Lentisphaeria bacterium]